MKKRSFRLSVFVFLLLAALSPTGVAHEKSIDSLSLEDLMNVVVTSVAKKTQTLGEIAAAVHVISAEDIRRSGASNIPEALRLAPGVQVSALGNNKWAVSIRGFADRFSNKLLVLVDGRSVYTPLFSGVMWETLEVPLENIARIEVIRGPGASVWGANAMNGVINIITLSPFDAHGGYAALAAGSELKGYGHARYGWHPDLDTAVTVHARFQDVDASRQLNGGKGADDWQALSTGFKMERLLDESRVHVQGGVSRSLAGDELIVNSVPPAISLVRGSQRNSTGHLMGRWEGKTGRDRQDSVQFYVERSELAHILLVEQLTTADLEYQQRVRLDARHDVIWGLGYRYHADRIDGLSAIQFDERMRTTHIYSLFAQDEITLQPERWQLNLGARLEHNDYTGYVLQPNLRLLWTPDTRTSTWLSLARAKRTPARVERGASALVSVDPFGLPPSVVKVISSRLQDEQVDAVDLGWRRQVSRNLSVDLAAFYYRYDKLRGAAAAAPTFVPPGYVLIETQENNANRANGYGLEVSVDWRPAQNWRLQTHYSGLWERMITGNVPGQLASDYADVSPTHQFSLRSSLDLNARVRWDAWLRYVSRISNPNFAVPAYTTLDMRLAWQVNRELALALVGQNLLASAHPEYGSVFIRSTPATVQRGVYLRVDWQF